MKRNSIILSALLLITLPLTVFAQNPGIKFEVKQNLQEVINTAKKEGKYIFIDCYATWCIPCKKMDSETYPDTSLGRYINLHFVSIKLQFDSTENDGEHVKKWYREAQKMRQLYKIEALPTFLFLDPNGKIVHKGIGYMDVNNLKELAREALDSNSQYYTKIEKFRLGTLPYSEMRSLTWMAVKFKDKELSYKIANMYIKDDLLKRGKQELFTKDNISFITMFTKTSEYPGFTILNRNKKIVNDVMNDPWYIIKFNHDVIYREIIYPALELAQRSNDSTINWSKIESEIKSKYGEYHAERSLTDAKTKWYGHKQNWKECTKNLVIYVTKFGADLKNSQLNEHAWNIFKYSSNPDEIKTAARWMENVIKTDTTTLLPYSLDTYANLLYKSGHKDKAIEVAKQALESAKSLQLSDVTADYQNTIKKMKKGEPTWPQ